MDTQRFKQNVSFRFFVRAAKAGLFLLGALLLNSCIRGVLTDADDDSPVEIKLSGSVGNVSASGNTRAVLADDYCTKNDLPVTFLRIDQNPDGTWPSWEDYQVLNATRLKGAGQRAITFNAGPQFYLTRSANNNTRLISFYPGVGDGMEFSAEGWPCWDLSSGAVDVLMSEEKEANKTNQFGMSGNQFTYQHLLANITVTAKAQSAVSVSQWGSIRSIKLMSNPTEFVVNQLDRNDLWASGDHVDVLLRAPGSDLPMSGNIGLPYVGDPVTCGYALSFPWPNSILLEIETSLGGKRQLEVEPPTENQWLSGKSYTIQLEFIVDEVKASATIGVWQDGGSVSGDFQV